MDPEVARMMADLGNGRRDLAGGLKVVPRLARATQTQLASIEADRDRQVTASNSASHDRKTRLDAWNEPNTFEPDPVALQMDNLHNGQGHRAALRAAQESATAGRGNYVTNAPYRAGFERNGSVGRGGAIPRSFNPKHGGGGGGGGGGRSAPASRNTNRATSPRSHGTVRYPPSRQSAVQQPAKPSTSAKATAGRAHGTVHGQQSAAERAAAPWTSADATAGVLSKAPVHQSAAQQPAAQQPPARQPAGTSTGADAAARMRAMRSGKSSAVDLPPSTIAPAVQPIASASSTKPEPAPSKVAASALSKPAESMHVAQRHPTLDYGPAHSVRSQAMRPVLGPAPAAKPSLTPIAKPTLAPALKPSPASIAKPSLASSLKLSAPPAAKPGLATTAKSSHAPALVLSPAPAPKPSPAPEVKPLASTAGPNTTQLTTKVNSTKFSSNEVHMFSNLAWHYVGKPGEETDLYRRSYPDREQIFRDVQIRCIKKAFLLARNIDGSETELFFQQYPGRKWMVDEAGKALNFLKNGTRAEMNKYYAEHPEHMDYCLAALRNFRTGKNFDAPQALVQVEQPRVQPMKAAPVPVRTAPPASVASTSQAKQGTPDLLVTTPSSQALARVEEMRATASEASSTTSNLSSKFSGSASSDDEYRPKPPGLILSRAFGSFSSLFGDYASMTGNAVAIPVGWRLGIAARTRELKPQLEAFAKAMEGMETKSARRLK